MQPPSRGARTRASATSALADAAVDPSAHRRAQGANALTTREHVDLLTDRLDSPTYTPSKERPCLAQRGPNLLNGVDFSAKSFEHQRKAEEARRAAESPSSGGGASGGSGSSVSVPAPSGLPEKTHEQIMKEYNDYTYGSGRASSCPYSDPSLCRK